MICIINNVKKLNFVSGFAIYGFYGWRNSTEAILEKERQMKLSESKRTLVLNGPGDSTKL